MVREKNYNVQLNSKVAIFTWHGAQVQINGPTQFCYVSEDTPMVFYVNLHEALEQIRKKNSSQGLRGPRIMICGPPDSGKSTLSRILCNYASRLGRKLIYVDLDCRNNSLGLSNTIGAIQIAKPVSVEHEFMEELGSPPPLVYFTGDSRKTRELIFDSLLRRVIDDINMKFENCAETNYGGMVVNTSGCQTPEDFQEIEAIAKIFEIDVCAILGSERVLNQLTQKFKLSSLNLRNIMVPKSGGVISKTIQEKTDLIDLKSHQYFYGINSEWIPYNFEVKMNDVNIYRITCNFLIIIIVAQTYWVISRVESQKIASQSDSALMSDAVIDFTTFTYFYVRLFTIIIAKLTVL